MITTLIVSAGQYEQSAIKVTVRHKTDRGLKRRITQLRNEYAVYGDNHAGIIPAMIAHAHEDDKWGDNQIIGGQWCEPATDWI